MRPIGVFDSGIGGLTVVKALRNLLPGEEIFYIGDTARLPYGTKSASTVERYSFEIADMLLAENAKIIESVFRGERGPRRDVVLLNAAPALVAGGVAKTWKEGLQLAAEAIDNGSAMKKLRQLKEFL